MGEFDTSHARDTCGPTPAQRELSLHVPTVQEQQQQALVEAERDVDAIESNLHELQRTTDRRVWESRRAEIERTFASSKDALDKARQQQAPSDAIAKLEQRVAAATATLADARTPKVYRAVALETEIVAALLAKPVGSAREGNARKEAAIRDLLLRLDVADSRALIDRLKTASPGDELAAAFHRLQTDRQRRLLDTLEGARKRAAVAAEPALRRSPEVSRAEPELVPKGSPAEVLQLDPNAPEVQTSTAHHEAPTSEDWTPTRTAAAHYLFDNSHVVWRELNAYLADVIWPDPSPRWKWVSGRAWAHEAITALRADVPDFVSNTEDGVFDTAKIDAALYPHDVFSELVPMISRNALTWMPAITQRLGQVFHMSLLASLQRMAPRYLAAVDAHARAAAPVRLTRDDLLTSHPMDRFVARALISHDVVSVTPEGKPNTKPTARRTTVDVTPMWQGAEDPRLWNWVRVDRTDATAEDVAASLFAYARQRDFAGESPSFLAYGIAAVPPWFGLPASWARQFPEAIANAPEAVKQGHLPDPANDTIQARLAAFAATKSSDSLALAQAAAGPADRRAATMTAPAIAAVFNDSLLQLEHLRRMLTAWGLTGDLVAEILYVSGQKDHVAVAPDDQLASWAQVALGQRDRLFRIGGAVQELLSAAATTKMQPRDTSTPIHKLLSTYASAAATSHLASTSEQLIARAQTDQAGLATAALQANIVDLEAAMNQAHAGRANAADKATRDLAHPYVETLAHAKQLENRLLDGGAVDPGELERVQIDAQMIALRARMHTTQIQLDGLVQGALAVGVGFLGSLAKMGSQRFGDLNGVAQFIHDAIGDVYLDLNAGQQTKPHSGDADGLTPPALDLSAKKTALARAQARFAKLSQDHDLAHFFIEGAKLIEEQRFRTLWVQFALMIGINLASAGTAGVVAESMGTAYLAAEGVETITSLSLGARAAIQIGSTATELVTMSAGQTLVTGESFWRSLGDNAMFVGASKLTLGPIMSDVNAAVAYEKLLDRELKLLDTAERNAASLTRAVARGSADLTAWSVRQTVTLSGEAIMGMAYGSLVAQLHGELAGQPTDAGQLQNLLINGAASAVGRMVHASIGERLPSYERLKQRTENARLQKLAADAVALQTAAAEVTKSKNATAALALLQQQIALLSEELEVLDEQIRTAESRGKVDPELMTARGELAHQMDALTSTTMLSVHFHLSNLRELVPGTVWAGTREDIARATRDAQHTHPDAKISNDAGTTTITIGTQVIELHETGTVPPAPTAAAAVHRPPGVMHELATNISMVPGSELRGRPHGSEASKDHTTRIENRVKQVLPNVPSSGAVRLEAHGTTLLATMRDGTTTSIEVVVANTEGQDVARIIPNSDRVARHENTPLQGEHLIQLSDQLAVDQVERTVANGVARLLSIHEQAMAGKYAHDGQKLTSDTRGRIAEIEVLTRQIRENPQAAPALRRELVALAEYLGLRDGTPASLERRVSIDAALDVAARDELERAIESVKGAELEALRSRVTSDLAEEHAAQTRRAIARDAPHELTTRPGTRMTRDELAEAAHVAERLRWMVSQRTLAKYRALAKACRPGEYPKVAKFQRGGGAALAAREPDALLVDARGRWQADASINIAQVAQQLQELFRARFGDVREVAAPNERVPMEAIRYWEDSLAADGEAIDGIMNHRIEGGKLLGDIYPSDGSGLLTVEIVGETVSATGFPAAERVPGVPFALSSYDAITKLDQAVTKLASTDGALAGDATAALAKLHQIRGAQDADVVAVGAVLHEFPAVEAALRASTPDAMTAITAHENWSNLVAVDAFDGYQQLFFGKEVNEQAIRKLVVTPNPKTGKLPQHFVFAGSGGTSVSAAEIILSASPTVEVTLIGRDQAPGLFVNGQFRSMVEAHADADLARDFSKKLGQAIKPGDGRLHLTLNEDLDFQRVSMRENPDGTQAYDLIAYTDKEKTKSETFGSGDMLIASMGSANQLPSDLAELALVARRAARSDPASLSGRLPVEIHADFSTSGKYLGYTLTIRMNGARHDFSVTGASSRYIPKEEFKAMGPEGLKDLERIDNAAKDDAHSKSGTFAGGFAASAVQGRYHAGTADYETRDGSR